MNHAERIIFDGVEALQRFVRIITSWGCPPDVKHNRKKEPDCVERHLDCADCWIAYLAEDEKEDTPNERV